MIMMPVAVIVMVMIMIMIMAMIVVAVRGAHVRALRVARMVGNGPLERFIDKKKKPRAPRGNSARGFNARIGSTLVEDYWSSLRTFCWL